MKDDLDIYIFIGLVSLWILVTPLTRWLRDRKISRSLQGSFERAEKEKAK